MHIFKAGLRHFEPWGIDILNLPKTWNLFYINMKLFNYNLVYINFTL